MIKLAHASTSRFVAGALVGFSLVAIGAWWLLRPPEVFPYGTARPQEVNRAPFVLQIRIGATANASTIGLHGEGCEALNKSAYLEAACLLAPIVDPAHIAATA
ncbi:MAG: hypothetical protein ACREMY_33135, partial [bacterium]